MFCTAFEEVAAFYLQTCDAIGAGLMQNSLERRSGSRAANIVVAASAAVNNHFDQPVFVSSRVIVKRIVSGPSEEFGCKQAHQLSIVSIWLADDEFCQTLLRSTAVIGGCPTTAEQKPTRFTVGDVLG
jgi:hypothetical protein